MIEERSGAEVTKTRWILGVLTAAVFGIARIARELAGWSWRIASSVLRFAPLRSAVRTGVVAVGLALLALVVDATCFMPVPDGFVVACFPHKIRGASAGWTRAVAIFDDALMAAPR